MWYVLYRDGSNRLSVHRDEMKAINAALRLPSEQLRDCEVGPVGGTNAEIVRGAKLRHIRDRMRAPGIDSLTPVLLAAFLGALLLVVLPGDQTRDALLFLGKTAGVW